MTTKFKLLPLRDAVPTPNNVFSNYVLSGKTPPSKSDNSTIYNQIPVENQESLGDCTIFALFNWDYFMRAIQGLPFQRLSECAEYYEELALLGQPGVDYGGYTWSAVGILEEMGAMLEQYDPYDPNYATNFKNPPPADWIAAYKINAKNAQQIAYSNQAEMETGIKDVLSQKRPILFGTNVFEQIFSAPGGVLAMPGANEQPIGGHELVLVDYDAAMTSPVNPGITGYCKLRNSWGPGWGDNGNGWVPFDYLYLYAGGGLVAGVPDIPVTHNYTFTAVPSPETVQAGQPIKLSVLVADNNIPLANQAVQSMYTGIVSGGSGETTDATGVVSFTVTSAVPGAATCTLVWFDPANVKHSAVVPVTWTAVPASTKLWHVQVGAFSVKDHADTLAAELKAAGYPVFEVQYSSVVD